MTDDERAEVRELSECYRQLFAAIIHRAVLDLRYKCYHAEAKYFFTSGRADIMLTVLDIDPEQFKRQLCL